MDALASEWKEAELEDAQAEETTQERVPGLVEQNQHQDAQAQTRTAPACADHVGGEDQGGPLNAHRNLLPDEELQLSILHELNRPGTRRDMAAASADRNRL
jgi:hypothetical protein